MRERAQDRALEGVRAHGSVCGSVFGSAHRRIGDKLLATWERARGSVHGTVYESVRGSVENNWVGWERADRRVPHYPGSADYPATILLTVSIMDSMDLLRARGFVFRTTCLQISVMTLLVIH